MAFTIDATQCQACGSCAVVCLFDSPFHDYEKGIYEIDSEKCRDCGECMDVCPVSCIHPDPNVPRLVYIELTGEDCINCKRCVKYCLANAITVDPLTGKHQLDIDRCILCGRCIKHCRPKAIKARYE
ncbi:MAG: 4Fe-4S binding protein [Clostridia bacterium]|nr:4Fe-4S binding protein [Clostridia bacterium]